ncbi:hypothetical protein [Salinibaculum rarum]|uniref:hypothetical protein n=1 Tax=Salinibaculum rarum TaxID=3058903 RepID=UPI00265EF086|nr:hypothetical protein [Salinibaculum sp. KK48]
MDLEAESIYRHQEEGEVLVLGIDRQYESYDTAADEGVTTGIVVRYAREWDGYGAMPGAATAAPLYEFVAATGEKIREFERITMTDE